MQNYTMFRHSISITSLTLLSTAALAGPADVDTLINLGKSKNQAFSTLKTFTSKFGPRLTGSPNLARAQDWAVSQFKAWGLQNVHKEQWGEVPVGFYRGKRQVARMVAPWNIEFQFTTPAWTPGTNGMSKIRPVLQPKTEEEFRAMEASLKGAWVVMDRPAGLRGPAASENSVDKLLADAPVAGYIYGTGDERVHTGGRFASLTMENLPKKVELRIRKSDHRSLVAALKQRRVTELELDIENHFVKGPVPQYNVIAEIKGSEKPDEVVIVCGHFDSWNGPGSVGANDNGTGSAVTLEAARLMAKSGVKPKRTVRFILWSGEEQGLLGSRAYVTKHANEHEKISAVFNDDGGTNYQGGYQCLASMKPMLEAAIAPVQKAFPDLPMQITTTDTMSAFGSSDHAPFVWEGIPAFFSMESGRADYGYVWHTQNDRPENSIPEYLVQSSTNAAAVALNIANAETMLPRFPKPQRSAYWAHEEPVGGAVSYFHTAHQGCDHENDYTFFVLDRLYQTFRRIR